jgi:hypothetical protein
MTTSRLGLLIDSLASGANVLSSRNEGDTAIDVNEMGIVLNAGANQVCTHFLHARNEAPRRITQI